MTLVDRLLATVGGLAAAVERRLGGSRRAAWAVVAVLFLISAIPTVVIGSSPRPVDLTFDDVRNNRVPAMTSWVRMEGDLTKTEGSGQGVYHLMDPNGSGRYVAILASSPLELGTTMVTGTLSVNLSSGQNLGSIEADIPAEPRRDEPFWLILLPGAIGLVLAAGLKIGYPVVRPDRQTRPQVAPLRPDDRLAARWGGRIRSETVDWQQLQPCTVGVALGREMWQLTIVDAASERVVPVRRRAPVRRVRMWRFGSSSPALDVRAAGADLMLEFDDATGRDRLAATLL